MSIHIKELLPKGVSIKDFTTGSELLLAYELGKYLELMLKESLSVEGVGVDKELEQTGHFSFVVEYELIDGIEPTTELELPDYDTADFFLPTQNVAKVDLKFENDCVIFNINSNKRANSALNTKNRSTAYVSLMAFVLVKNYIDQKPNRKLIIDHENYEHKDDEYDDLIDLQRIGILPKSILSIKFKTQGVIQLPWATVVKDYRSKGLMNEVYSSEKKYEYLSKEGLEVGDVVLRYSRTFDQIVEDTIGTLKTCYPAVIRYYDEKIIVLEYYRTVETRLTQQTRIEGLCAKVDGLAEALTPDEFIRATYKEETIPLAAVGIGTCTYLEDTFIFEPVESDGTTQFVRKKENPKEITTDYFDTLNTIFAVFEDRGVNYNKDKFLQKYFYSKSKKPKYYDYV